MAGRDHEQPQRGPFRPVMLVVGTVLAVTATGTLVLTDNPRVLRLAVVVTLWAFVLGAMAGARRQSSVEAAEAGGAGGGPTRREIELRRAYEIELDREVAARREYELRVEVEIRRELESGLYQQVDALRHEVTELRRDVVERLAGDLRLERIAWQGESTRLTGGTPGSHGFDTGGTPAVAGKVAESNGLPAAGLPAAGLPMSGLPMSGLPTAGMDLSPPLRREPPAGVPAEPRPSPAPPPPARGVPRPAPHQPPAPPPLRAETPPTPPVRPDPLTDPLPPEALLPLASFGPTRLGSGTGEPAWSPTPATASPAAGQPPPYPPYPGQPPPFEPYPSHAGTPAGGRHAQSEATGLGSAAARHGGAGHSGAGHASPSHASPSHGRHSQGRPSHGVPDQRPPEESLTGASVPLPSGSRHHRYREDDEENEVLSRALRER